MERKRPLALPTQRPAVVAEVAQSHDGSLGLAHAFIDAARFAGADAVKFQTHIADEESRASEPWRIAFSYEDETRFSYWKRMEFSLPQWKGLREHADEAGLAFISSPFSVAAVELLTEVGVSAWKIASGQLTDTQMVRAIARQGEPVFLSTGMSKLAEVDEAVALLKEESVNVTVMQCTSRYPTPAEDVGLKALPLFAQRYGTQVGLSDHSGTIFPSLAAVVLGASVLEVHLTLSQHMFTPDLAVSVTVEEMSELTRGVRFLSTAWESPWSKNEVAERLTETRQIFMKSAVAARDLEQGSVLTEDAIAYKKPGDGLSPSEIQVYLGRRLRVGVRKDESFSINSFLAT